VGTFSEVERRGSGYKHPAQALIFPLPFLDLENMRWYVRASEELKGKEDGKTQRGDTCEREEVN
jgi:hypothetical protein